MPIKIGNSLFSKIFKGDTEVTKTYLGSSLLYELVTAIRGEAVYNIPGTYQWTAPAGVTSVSVVAIGGGASGAVGYINNTTGSALGGGGGALAWKNNIPVVPGQSYTVVVGAGGRSVVRTTNGFTNGNPGGQSYFIDTSILRAGGGTNTTSNSTFTGDGGGNGSRARNVQSTSTYLTAHGGAGAGGYGGFGGAAGYATSTTLVAPTSSIASGGGGGSATTGTLTRTIRTGFDGGGVGIYGQGTNGTAANGRAGYAGSGGPETTASPAPGITNRLYGAGGWGMIQNTSSTGVTVYSGDGGNGAVRIVWGEGREFPNTDVAKTNVNVNFSNWSYSINPFVAFRVFGQFQNRLVIPANGGQTATFFSSTNNGASWNTYNPTQTFFFANVVHYNVNYDGYIYTTATQFNANVIFKVIIGGQEYISENANTMATYSSWTGPKPA
jgi:hypothetical protein